jgi:hypothetical protein
VKRLALLVLATAALATGVPAAQATVKTCDNVPVFFDCYHWGPNGVEHCTVWVYPHCINDLSDVLGPIS